MSLEMEGFTFLKIQFSTGACFCTVLEFTKSWSMALVLKYVFWHLVFLKLRNSAYKSERTSSFLKKVLATLGIDSFGNNQPDLGQCYRLELELLAHPRSTTPFYPLSCPLFPSFTSCQGPPPTPKQVCEAAVPGLQSTKESPPPLLHNLT